MMKQIAMQGKDSSPQTQRTPIFHYYFSNLNVMNEKHTVPNRKVHDLYFSASRQSLQQRHSEYLQQQLCLQHSLPIEYLCFSCPDSVLCTQCMNNGAHLHHDVKNIERSKQFLKGELQDWKIRLETKSQRLENVEDQIRSNSAEVHQFAQLYKEKLASEFEQIIKSLKQRLDFLKKSVDLFSNDYKTDCLHKRQQIKTRRLQLTKMVSIVKNKIDKATVHHQAQYFSQKKQYIDRLCDQEEVNFYKLQFIEPNWGVDAQTFKNIQNDIEKITINFKYPEPYRDLFQMNKRKVISTNFTKKSKKGLKLPEAQKFQRVSSKARYSNCNSITPFLATFTPKNASKEKKSRNMKKVGGETLLKKRKKSSNKIVSMPASPQREPNMSAQASPSQSRKNLFKKKEHQ